MIKLLIIADDFTGALDTGVQFSKKGAKTLVTTDTDIDFFAIPRDVSVLAVDTESRHIPAEEAYARVFALAARAKEAEIECIYKKTDSTLRGNIGAELDAVVKAAGETVMFVPAYPKSGRTTLNGIQYVNGVPLGETAIAKDPIDPVTLSSVTDIIALQTGRKAMRVPLICCGRAHFSELDSIYVFDSETDEDLDLVAWALNNEGKTRVLAGCAGFAEKLPELLKLKTVDLPEPMTAQHTLIAAGSVNPVSLAQLDNGAKYGFVNICLTPEQKLASGEDGAALRAEAADAVLAGLRSSGKAALRAIGERADMDAAAEYAASAGIDASAVPAMVADAMGGIVSSVFAAGERPNLVVFGGDTLLSVLKKLGCTGLIPHTEIAPGIVMSRVLCPTGDFEVITKAGGFGTEDAVGDIVRFLSR